MERTKKAVNILITVFLIALSVLFFLPVFVVLMNSFKGQFFIRDTPFAFPNSDTFVGFSNYLSGLINTGFISAIGLSLFITVSSVIVLVLFTAMTAWYITRVKSRFTSTLYYLFVFSMIVPFQMVMYTMSKTANILHIDNPVGLILIYLGFGAGLDIFIYSGFVKSIPIDMEEAATIDGCNPIQLFFSIVFPILKPTVITIAILNTMWIWNDYLLPLLVIGNMYRTIPIAVQYLQSGYGGNDMGALMAMLILAVLPVVIFYLTCQKYIIKGILTGAVKG